MKAEIANVNYTRFIRFAKEGQIWICPGCGKSTKKDRYSLGDTSCVIWAVLCLESSIVRDVTGKITKAEAVTESESR